MYVAFDVGNLEPVAATIRKKSPEGGIIICADNDLWTKDNPGVSIARKVACLVKGKIAIPRFKDAQGKPSDFNDLYIKEGLDEVTRQIKYASDPVEGPVAITACELLDTTFPEPRWVIPGIVPDGLSFLSGKPKMGKSIAALNVGLAVAFGGKVFSKIDVDKGTVIYLALEDTPQRLQRRINQMLTYNQQGPENLVFFTDWPRMDQGGLARLDQEIVSRVDVRLIIIDTWKLFRPQLKNRNKNPYDYDYETVSPVKKLADKHNISILLIHHLRKTEADDVFDTMSGSFGLTGAADGLLALVRKTGQADAVLHVTGRDVEAAEYALKFEPQSLSWDLLGQADEVKSTIERQTLYDALKNAGEPLTPKELTEITGLKRKYIQNTLPILIQEGTIIKRERGIYVFIGDIEDNGDIKDIEDNGDIPEDSHCPLSSGGTNAEDIYNGHKNNSLETNVLDVHDVLKGCGNCGAYDKTGKECFYATVYEGKFESGIPAEAAALNCPKQRESRNE